MWMIHFFFSRLGKLPQGPMASVHLAWVPSSMKTVYADSSFSRALIPGLCPRGSTSCTVHERKELAQHGLSSTCLAAALS